MGILDSFHFDVPDGGPGSLEGEGKPGSSEEKMGTEGEMGEDKSEEKEEEDEEKEEEEEEEDEKEEGEGEEGEGEGEGERKTLQSVSLQLKIHDTIVQSILPCLAAILTKVLYVDQHYSISLSHTHTHYTVCRSTL